MMGGETLGEIRRNTQKHPIKYPKQKPQAKTPYGVRTHQRGRKIVIYYLILLNRKE